MINVGFCVWATVKTTILREAGRRLKKHDWFITLNTITSSAKGVTVLPFHYWLVCLQGDAKLAGWISTTFGGNVENGTREFI